MNQNLPPYFGDAVGEDILIVHQERAERHTESFLQRNRAHSIVRKIRHGENAAHGSAMQGFQNIPHDRIAGHIAVRDAGVHGPEALPPAIVVLRAEGDDVVAVAEQPPHENAHAVMIVDFDVGYDRVGILRRCGQRGSNLGKGDAGG